MTAGRLAIGALIFALGLGGCADINWQGTYDDWAKSVCRENGQQCAER